MSYFAAVLTRAGDRWRAGEAELEDCESLTDLGDLLRDNAGEIRVLLIEQDDEYAAIVRLDSDEDDPRAFLSDGHAADAYSIAALVAEDLVEIGEDELEDDEDAPPAHDSAPFGDAEIVEDLGTPASDLLSMCAHPGTLPIDVLVTVCEKAGCGAAFEDLRG
jgi:putative tRNA adenosine deaminase-associated protein